MLTLKLPKADLRRPLSLVCREFAEAELGGESGISPTICRHPPCKVHPVYTWRILQGAVCSCVCLMAMRVVRADGRMGAAPPARQHQPCESGVFSL